MCGVWGDGGDLTLERNSSLTGVPMNGLPPISSDEDREGTASSLLKDLPSQLPVILWVSSERGLGLPAPRMSNGRCQSFRELNTGG